MEVGEELLWDGIVLDLRFLIVLTRISQRDPPERQRDFAAQ
jgi:hypothetical protein